MASDGYIYVIKHKDCCKIGYTANPERRIKALITKLNLFYPEIFISEYCGIARDYESIIHHKFIEKLIGEEWFRVDFEEAKEEVKKTINLGLHVDYDLNIKKPRVTITPNTLILLDELCEKSKSPIQGVSNKIQVIADLVMKAHKKEVKQ